MVIEKLKTLKEQSKITIAELSKLSGIPEATIRRIFSGDTPDPRFDTVAKLVMAMGGSLDDFIGGSKKTEIEGNAVVTLKETYETRIADIKEHLKSLQKYNHTLIVITITLMLFVIGLLVLELTVRDSGWIRY